MSPIMSLPLRHLLTSSASIPVLGRAMCSLSSTWFYGRARVSEVARILWVVDGVVRRAANVKPGGRLREETRSDDPHAKRNEQRWVAQALCGFAMYAEHVARHLVAAGLH